MAPRNDAPVVARKASRVVEKISSLGVIAPPPIEVSSPKFNGSLAALFTCVQDRKVDLLDVPLAPICEAYFAYLLEATSTTLDEAAAALMALAYLIERKAWALLPVAEPEPESDDALELIAPTTHEYQLAIESLRVWHEEREKFFFRSGDNGPDPYEIPFDLGDVTSADLARALERLLRKATPEAVKPLNKPRKSLTEQMRIVHSALTTEWRSLENLVTQPFTREDAVYWFLALLELIRLGQAGVRLHDDDVQFARKS